MALRDPLEVGEWYHCYTRGVDKRKTFLVRDDYQRFLQTLYVANSATAIQRSDLWYVPHEDFFSLPRGEQLVSIGGYCLMPNHFHLIMQETTEGGISRFMQKLGTSYTMYFNARNQRLGSLFVKPFRSKHISKDNYFHRVIQYIHLNPAELFESKWKTGVVKSKKQLEHRLEEYAYSSLTFYLGKNRAEHALLDPEATELLKGDMPKLSTVIDEAAEYYAQLALQA